MHEDVVRFDIAMHNVVPGKYLEGLNDLAEVNQTLFLRQWAFFLEQFVEGASVAELVDEVEVVGCFEHVDVLDDVGAGLKGRQDVDLVDGAFLEFGDFSELFGLDDLDGDLLLGDHVDGFIDLGIDSLAELLFELVVLNNFTHSIIIRGNND
jgi:hypothetical protein